VPPITDKSVRIFKLVY